MRSVSERSFDLTPSLFLPLPQPPSFLLCLSLTPFGLDGAPPMGGISLLTLSLPLPLHWTLLAQKMKEPTQKNMNYIISLHLVAFEDKILFSCT